MGSSGGKGYQAGGPEIGSSSGRVIRARVIRLQAHQVEESSGCRAIRLQGHQVARVIGLQGHQVVRVIGLQGHQVVVSAGGRVIRL